MENSMFCYQCEQTFGGKGCTKSGVCGKTPEIANLQDLLIYQLKGISCYAKPLIESGKVIDEDIVKFVENSLFTTLTNVNFDPGAHIKLLKESQKIKEFLRDSAPEGEYPDSATYNLSDTKEEMLKDSVKAGIMYDESLDADIRSLRSTVLYGLKGISAYGHQARFIGYNSEQVDKFYFLGLESTTNDNLTLEDMINITMKTGDMSVEVMKTLDAANTSRYNNPSMHKVNINIKKGPFIIVSGHDLRDLEMLLQQTEGKGINIYTHGEMLPSHGYPSLKKYKHLVGNYGSAWQNQQKEFDGIPGCILMTTNCLMRPRETYKDRIFTTSVVGWDGVKHIDADENGVKDFSEIINKALDLGGFEEDEESKEILVGFGHNETLSHADEIVNAVKNGKIRRFFLIGGCDGARPGRNYYTEFAQKVPKDCVILTLACGKYRFNKLDFGTVAGLPRLLDIGQCNDAYSAVRIATSLADAFDTNVNSLPLTIVLSWYEQKAVADLLALLSLGIRGMYLGPSLPAFISPNVLQYLVDTFNIKPISNAEDDLKNSLNQVEMTN
ncbi:hydroxylamine reductase [Clostridium pasteurianum DSM 525 = ATCC 6013]|uniref:Hydroxylamine reductase n=1 Tax=Clostridium pasteurianum DSM 525 = ATCC 6013 TaxID=1262449 RepID=A0A0H3IZM5_CLOPA|nr:hydroxylamine reductase [Clostridium pasteurianum]AJA46484.1 hydroxylamine reductase [Clostridium pasteurianum DSM 525 = ATCC 6013]AJA50472.1 hydroxylamine reductase [Clostridium pasteurianum DSM 525 = ATCC 6013]AOZ73912.1 hydroxylamine reductase [Clostridium pasteurianum DSM 525 = ATCC 6013]AOZ77709.1 hydroxylamine reductase [Clostridium pasteurianum]ELP61057.1 hybrid cluster protein [Clostridium pasteurianum DSM 525 = ATCC 6013]